MSLLRCNRSRGTENERESWPVSSSAANAHDPVAKWYQAQGQGVGATRLGPRTMLIIVAKVELLIGDERPKYKLHVPLIDVPSSDLADSPGIGPATVPHSRVRKLPPIA